MPTPPPRSAEPRPRYSVALRGFSDFESAALASFFRLAAARKPAYVQVDTLDAGDFLIANGDQPGVIAAVQAAGRALDTVFVGSHASPGALAWLPRPIDPLRILRALDALVEQRLNGRAEVPEAPAAPIDPLPPGLGQAARPRAVSPEPPPCFGGRGCDVLVVDDSAIARKFMQQRLQRLGYRVHLARTGSKDASDRVRGSLAGCDAYATKPLHDQELLQTLRAVDPGFDPSGDTALG